MSGLERTLGREANVPHIKYNKGKVEGHKLGVQEILGTLNTPDSPLGGATKPGLQLARVDPSKTATISVVENGTHLHQSGFAVLTEY